MKRQRRTTLSGFTLVEVLISIAIALVLIIGISQIFSIAQQTTGAGTALLTATESNRSVQSILTTDFRDIDNGVNESPGLVIASESIGAFRNAADMRDNRATDPSGRPDPLRVNDPASANGSLPTYSMGQVNARVHRYDKLGFFIRDRFTRQTGDAPDLTSSTTSDEAFIWLGHLSLPNNSAISKWRPATFGATSAQWFLPGYPGTTQLGKNDNNLFAADAILGREVILLTPNTNNESAFPGPPNFTGFDPLSLLVPAYTVDQGTKQKVVLADSRFDLASTTIADYRQFIAANPTFGNYPWWSNLIGTYQASGSSYAEVRYHANPFIVKPPAGTTGAAAANWLSAAAAQAYPVFVRGCTHFIVEFAGDFVTQDPDPTSHTYGKVTGVGPDNEVDFTVDPQGFRHIRWYGFPRDVNGDGRIDPLNDVVPINIVLQYFGVPVPPQGNTWIERTPAWPMPPTNSASGLPDFGMTRAVPFTAATANNPPISLPYVCAWGPDTDAANVPRPKMIRIIMAIDDPTGHLNQEQLYEYVYELP